MEHSFSSHVAAVAYAIGAQAMRDAGATLGIPATPTRPLSPYTVQGWVDGDTYDTGKPADYAVKVMAHDEGEADTKGDAKLARLHERCAVIVSHRSV